jgi:hypothetical protein
VARRYLESPPVHQTSEIRSTWFVIITRIHQDASCCSQIAKINRESPRIESIGHLDGRAGVAMPARKSRIKNSKRRGVDLVQAGSHHTKFRTASSAEVDGSNGKCEVQFDTNAAVKMAMRRRYTSSLLPTWSWTSTEITTERLPPPKCQICSNGHGHALNSGSGHAAVALNGYKHRPARRVRRRKSKISSTCWKYVLTVCCGSALVMAVTIFTFFTASKTSTSSSSHELILPDAIVTLATNDFRATLLSSTLRNVGGWDGPIYVFSDDPDNENSAVVTPIDIREHHPEFLSAHEFQTYKEHHDSNHPHPWMKWHKTQLFDLLPDSVDQVLFLDADIVVQKSLDDFWHDILYSHHHHDDDDKNCDLSLYPERWYTNTFLSKYADSGLYNSGILLAKRSSLPLLRQWGRLIVTPPFSKRDQPKLTQAIHQASDDVTICTLNHRTKHVMYEPDLLDRFWRALGRTTTFRHFASFKKVQKLWKETYQDDR